MWGVARRVGASVLLRIEDHDRQRCRPEFDTALLEDLDWLGFRADEGPVRQSDADRPYRAALGRLAADELVYACDCSRARFVTAGWSGPGCPGACRSIRRPLDSPGSSLRVALGAGTESWVDRLAGPVSGPVAPNGDPAIRDRLGNWTYLFAVVVDDRRQEVDLVIRGRDLLEATAPQLRLTGLLGRPSPPAYAHHRLIRKPSGAKLSKADGDTGIRDLRAAGATAPQLIGRAAAAVGLLDRPRPVAASEVAGLFG